MGFLGDLVDDIIDIPGKVLASPMRIACRALEHEWSKWVRVGNMHIRTCEFCGKREKIKAR